MKENIGLITRENYVCYDGLPYDYEAVHRQWLSTSPTDTGGDHINWLPTNGPNAWSMSELVHESFDKLSGVEPETRKKIDVIKFEVFDFLESQIKTCEGIKKYFDKFIAHAAVPETRIGLSVNQKAITLDHLKAHHKTIYQVASFISVQLLYEPTLGGLRVPQFDHLANLDKSWTTSENLRRAHQIWDEYAKEVSKWASASFWPPELNNDEMSKL